MRIAAVDPGYSGAVAILECSEANIVRCLNVMDLPLRHTPGYAKPLLDGVKLASFFRDAAVLHHVVIERVGAAPGQGVASMFRFGYGAGVVEGVCCGVLGLVPDFIAPLEWRNAVGLPAGQAKSERKSASLSRARVLFPYRCDILSRVSDHGRADAMLIGVGWLRRRNFSQH